MESVYITKRGKVWHTSRDCKWLRAAHDNAVGLGRAVYPVREVTRREVGRRAPCRVCRNGGEPPKRGKGNG